MPLFNNPKRVTYLIAAFVLVFIAALATRCHAAEGDWLTFSAGHALTRAEATVADLAYAHPRWVGDAGYELGLTLIGSSAFRNRPFDGNIAVHAQIMDGFGPVDIGIGAAYLQHTDVINGSNLNFFLSLGVHYKRLQVRYNHISNAGTTAPNIGRDMLLVGWRF